MICVLAGGVGAARFLAGLVQVVPPDDVVAVVNTADDLRLHGLAISPDLDTVTYTLAGAIDPERGWGLAGESWRVMEALEPYGTARPAGSSAAGIWFRLGDRDLATHLYRTHRLAEGAPLSTATAEIAGRWGVRVRLLPMTDQPVATVVTVPGRGDLAFQDYFVGLRHQVPVQAVRFAGADAARPGPGVLDAVAAADVVVIAPSNPIVSIGPILAVPGVADALEAIRSKVVAVSPIVAGAALKGPADRMLTDLGHEASVVGVARIYRPVAGALVIDEADRGRAEEVETAGVVPVVTDTVMRTSEAAARLAEVTLGVAR